MVVLAVPSNVNGCSLDDSFWGGSDPKFLIRFKQCYLSVFHLQKNNLNNKYIAIFQIHKTPSILSYLFLSKSTIEVDYKHAIHYLFLFRFWTRELERTERSNIC